MKKLLSIFLILNQTYLYGQLSRPTSSFEEALVERKARAFRDNPASYEYLKDFDVESSKLIEDVKNTVNNFVSQSIYENYGENLADLVEQKYAFDYISDYESKPVKILNVKENLRNYVETVKVFKKCNESDRGLCKSTISYLSAQDMEEEAKPFKSKAGLSGLDAMLSKLYLESLKQSGRTIIEVSYRLSGVNPSVSNVANNLCIYDTKETSRNVCSEQGIESELRTYLQTYFEKIKSLKRYSYNEIRSLFNEKLRSLNENLKLIPVLSSCNIETIQKDIKTRQSNLFSALQSARSGGLDSVVDSMNLASISLSKSYIEYPDIRSFKSTFSDVDRRNYENYKNGYFELSESLIGSIVLSTAMQENDIDKKYYDEGLRVLDKGSGILEGLANVTNDLARLIGDTENLQRESKLLCSRYHREVSENQIKESVSETKKNLEDFGKYITKSVALKSTHKAVRRMLTYSPMLMAETLKHNIFLKDEMLKMIEEILKIDKREDLTIGILRGAAVLSMLAIPFTGAGFLGSASLSALLRGGLALTQITASIGEMNYASVLRDEKVNNSARISLVYKVLEVLEAPDASRSSNREYAEVYSSLVKEEKINRMMLALEFFSIIFDGLDVLKFGKSIGRLEKVSKALKVADTKLIEVISKSNKPRRISANLLDALNELEEPKRIKVLEKLNVMAEADLINFLETNGKGWSSKKLKKGFDGWLKPESKMTNFADSRKETPSARSVHSVTGKEKELFYKFLDDIKNNPEKRRAIAKFEDKIGEKFSEQEIYEFFKIHMIGADELTGNLATNKPGFTIMRAKKEAFIKFCKDNSLSGKMTHSDLDEFMRLFSSEKVKLFGFIGLNSTFINDPNLILMIKQITKGQNDSASSLKIIFKNGPLALGEAEKFSVIDPNLLDNIIHSYIKNPTYYYQFDLSTNYKMKISDTLKIEQKSNQLIFTESKEGKVIAKLTATYNPNMKNHDLIFEDLRLKDTGIAIIDETPADGFKIINEGIQKVNSFEIYKSRRDLVQVLRDHFGVEFSYKNQGRIPVKTNEILNDAYIKESYLLSNDPIKTHCLEKAIVDGQYSNGIKSLEFEYLKDGSSFAIIERTNNIDEGKLIVRYDKLNDKFTMQYHIIKPDLSPITLKDEIEIIKRSDLYIKGVQNGGDGLLKKDNPVLLSEIGGSDRAIGYGQKIGTRNDVGYVVPTPTLPAGLWCWDNGITTLGSAIEMEKEVSITFNFDTLSPLQQLKITNAIENEFKGLSKVTFADWFNCRIVSIRVHVDDFKNAKSIQDVRIYDIQKLLLERTKAVFK